MLRKLLLLAIPIVLMLAAACDDDGGSNGDPTAQLTPLSTDAAPTGQPELYETPGPTEGDEDSASSSDLFGAFNPFSALRGINGVPNSTEVDPALAAMLLTQTDLPNFSNMGEFSFNVPDSELGNVDMAARMFMSGDVTSTGELGVIVMSAVASLPADADMGELDQLAELSQSELDEIKASAGPFGDSFGDIRALDSSGLGERGGALHMELDFAAFFEGLGASPGDQTGAAAIAMDMYMFTRDGRMLMLMVMYPPGGSSVDGHALAEVMDSRAS